MSNWKPSSDYLKVAEANRQYYAEAAGLYDSTESCVVDRLLQTRLESNLDAILSLIQVPRSSIHALDACGGSGNVAMKLLDRGVQVTICDVSPDLLRIFEQRLRQSGFKANIVESEIGAFLHETEQQFDVIVFSSALHHLEDIESVLTLAYTRLTPGAYLFTTFDPLPRSQISRLAKAILRVDHYAFRVLRQTQDLPAAVRRRWRRAIRRQGPTNKLAQSLDQYNAGMLAEFHVETGIDDQALVDRLVALGFRVVWHDHGIHAHYSLVRWLLGRLKQSTDFKLLLQKPSSDI